MPTAIEWTDSTWNPTTGCDRVSPGCAHCYALTLARRLKAMGQPRYQKDGGKASGLGFGLTMHEDSLSLPLSWKKPRRVFVNSMSDLFHEEVTVDFIDRVFAVMALTPQHTYQILTKRPERMREYMNTLMSGHRNVALAARLMVDSTETSKECWSTSDEVLKALFRGPKGLTIEPLPNVWLGCTVENQHFADERIPILLDTPAAVRFVSVEPMLGPVDLCNLPSVSGIGRYLDSLYLSEGSDLPARLDWVIVGGESGPKHRPFDPDWARSIVAQCREARVAAFVKQLGGLRPGTRLEDLPEDLRVREFPDG